MKKNVDFCVLISSCDEYSNLWDNLSLCLSKHLIVDVNVYLVTESKRSSKFNMINIPDERWGFRVSEALKLIDEKIIFWILEDYFFNVNLTSQFFSQIISDFKTYQMDRLQLTPYDEKRELYFSDPELHKLNRDYQKINPDFKYSICMQPSLWDKKFLLEIIKPNYSPWQFEILGSKYCISNNLYIDKSIHKHIYFNAVRKLNKLNFSLIINYLDKIIDKFFYKKKKYKLSKGWKNFRISNNLEEIN